MKLCRRTYFNSVCNDHEWDGAWSSSGRQFLSFYRGDFWSRSWTRNITRSGTTRGLNIARSWIDWYIWSTSWTLSWCPWSDNPQINNEDEDEDGWF